MDITNFNKKQLTRWAVILLLIMAIPLTIYLVRHQQIFRGRATNNSRIEFLTSAGASIPDPATTTSQDIKVRLVFEPPTNNNPTNPPAPTTAQGTPTPTASSQSALCHINGPDSFASGAGAHYSLAESNITCGSSPYPAAGGCYWYIAGVSLQDAFSNKTSLDIKPADNVPAGPHSLFFLRTTRPGLPTAVACLKNVTTTGGANGSVPTPATYTISGNTVLYVNGSPIPALMDVALCGDPTCVNPLQYASGTNSGYFFNASPGIYWVKAISVRYSGAGGNCLPQPDAAVAVSTGDHANVSMSCDTTN